MTSSQLAATVVAALHSYGVRDVVAAPGSRNAPLLLALSAAQQSSQLNLHMRLDERGAGFLALGLAKASSRPVALVVTSGTAVGNLLPAVMEAHHSQIPLVVLSADRPEEVRGTAANQTTQQAAIFGDFVRDWIELDAAAASSTWVEPLSRVLKVALTPVRGPIQINMAFPEPLLGAGLAVAVPDPELGQYELESTDLGVAENTVVVVGDASPAVGKKAVTFAQQANLPILAEPSSNARVLGAISSYRYLLESELGSQIKRVIVFGRPTLSRPQRSILTNPDLDVIQVADQVPNGSYQGARVVLGNVTAAAHDLGWLARWQQADASARECLDKPIIESGITRWSLVEQIISTTNGNLFWGASSLIRAADTAAIASNAVKTWSNRGLAGIDGLLSTAVGIALVAGETTAVLGDISALHDLNALVIPVAETVPSLRIVVGNDDGGAIFSTLEQGLLPESLFERAFAVPHGRSLAQIATTLGVKATQVSCSQQLAEVLAQPIVGIELIEVRLDRYDYRRDEEQRRSAVLQSVQKYGK
ncbi:MAG: 2-succinyl-5-enolpyruvyl-6-hydroxy-3-cyclohexene-1-carboxylic-acid synthase [Propionibacteriaceae bacterium]